MRGSMESGSMAHGPMSHVARNTVLAPSVKQVVISTAGDTGEHIRSFSESVIRALQNMR